MAELPPYPDADDEIDVRTDRESPPGVPRWLKVSGLIALALAVLILVLLLIVGGRHGPGRHALETDTAAASVTATLPLSGGVACYQRHRRG